MVAFLILSFYLLVALLDHQEVCFLLFVLCSFVCFRNKSVRDSFPILNRKYSAGLQTLHTDLHCKLFNIMLYVVVLYATKQFKRIKTNYVERRSAPIFILSCAFILVQTVDI